MDGAMVGTVVGAILGFLASVLPKFFELVGQYFQHRQDLAVESQRISAGMAGVSGPSGTRIRAAETAEIVAQEAPVVLAPADTVVATGAEIPFDVGGAEADVVLQAPLLSRFFDFLRASVRPVITYGFFGLFLFIKIKGMYQGILVDHATVVQLWPVIWDEGTESLFAAILAFWFGSRAIEKSQARKIKL